METPGNDQPRSNTPKHPVQQRLTKEKRWGSAQKDLKRLRKQATYSGMDKNEGEAWAWAELDRLFPSTREPSQPLQIARETIAEESPKEIRSTAQIPIEQINQPTETIDQSSITGLDKIPSNWLPLPGNASLQAEISWVQANRLMVVKETGNGTVVSLRKAMGPPPSWAALGWLETSIRTYAKFVEVAAKATASIASEEEEVKREKVAIEEVRRLLNEMLLPGDA
jgi:hypothetical protein